MAIRRMRRPVRATLVALFASLGAVLLGPALGAAQEEIVVANALAPSVTAYARAANGDVNAERILGGADTALTAPSSVAVDFVHDELVVTNATNQSITVFARSASGNTAPLRTLAGAGAGLSSPVSAVVDPFRD